MKKLTQQEQFIRMLESSGHTFNAKILTEKGLTEITVNPNTQHELYTYFSYPKGEMVLIRS